MACRYRMIQIQLEQDNTFKSLDTTLQGIMEALLNNHQITLARLEQSFNDLRQSKRKEISRNKRQAELSILETLKFSSMNLRHDTITEAHQKTFNWVFCDPETAHKPWNNFGEWLKRENGKPGSGKSTLMRFIVEDPRSRDYAEIWAQNIPLEIPSFFFWNNGDDEIQRSQCGLLRTLLYEILEKHCDLIPVVFPREWKTVLENTRHGVPTKMIHWSLRTLKDAFKVLINKTLGKLAFCFFIDGLDEYQGDYWEIAELFVELSKSNHVKICLSSRSEIGFLDTFESMSQLRLHDLTALDIAIYVRDKLESNVQMLHLMDTSPHSSSALINEVVHSGNGVFLWIRLVVDSLFDGLRKRDDISTLRERLVEMPLELNDLYGRILSSIDQVHMSEASKLFQLYGCNETYSGLSIYLAYTISLRSPGQAIIDDTPLFKDFMSQPNPAHNFLHDLALVLRTRCGGLLELAKVGKVEYIHQTAKDYIQNANQLKARVLRPPQAWISFGRTLGKIMSPKLKPYIPMLVEEFDKVAQKELLLSESQAKHWSNYEYNEKNYVDRKFSWHITDILSASVQKLLYPYVKSKIIADSSLVQREYDPPLTALTFLESSLHPNLGLELLLFLLEHNSNMNGSCHGFSWWKIWLHIMHDFNQRASIEHSYPMDHMSLDNAFRVMEIMLQRGADIEVCCFKESGIWDLIYPNGGTKYRSRRRTMRRHGKQLGDRSGKISMELEMEYISEDKHESWDAKHSLEQKIKDVFDIPRADLSVKLLNLVVEKRAEKLAMEKHAQNQTSDLSGGKKRKQKQRNRNKGKGKRC
ncbi:hypothetical protein BCON_0227g00100 [Botryotinia convoluta]|uniref:Nephrocystin 3-like N-terminal domain-containing protein n=1 Tax=Botryotinia convoluta TaxID=54673 RepID=A0A4Z1HNL9_9HELO|nr:hypothetical protein BCON_0227g00100 [Botryotinia convoluta]